MDFITSARTQFSVCVCPWNWSVSDVCVWVTSWHLTGLNSSAHNPAANLCFQHRVYAMSWSKLSPSVFRGGNLNASCDGRPSSNDGHTVSETPPAGSAPECDEISASLDRAPESLGGEVEISVSKPGLGLLWPLHPLISLENPQWRLLMLGILQAGLPTRTESH